jgi:hypothetical protein
MQSHLSGLMLCIAMFSVSAASQTVTGSGYIGTIPVFTGTSTVGDSPISVSGSNVGIGTTTPQYPLDILGTAAPWAALRLQSYGGGVGTYSAAVYGGQVANMYGYIGSGNYFNSSYWHTGNNAASNILFNNDGSMLFTADAGLTPQTNYLPTGRMTILTNGSVGIGTTSPSEPLEVNGNTKVDGTLTVAGTGGVNVQSAGVTFPDGTLQTTAYPASSSGSSAPIEVQNNEAVINGGVSANGSGLKHISSSASCTTYEYDDDYCSVTITWPGTAFADTNYDVVCTPKTGYNASNSEIFLYVPDADKTTTSATVIIQVGSAGSNNGGRTTLAPGFSCIAIHD